MLQELLQRMGYPIHDKPGMFGVTTRDAVKDFQSKKGLKTTGSVDENLMDLIRQNTCMQADPKKVQKKTAPSPALNPVNQQQLDAITRLLIRKGIFTDEELSEEMTRPQPARVTQPPLT